MRGLSLCLLLLPALLLVPPALAGPESLPYAVVDTAELQAYDDARPISYPAAGQDFYGQDAQYAGNEPRYEVRDDGTVDDLVTGLTWTHDPGEKRTYRQAVQDAGRRRVGGHADWRLPSIKELYSLIRFDGTDPDPRGGTQGQRPFLDTRAFVFHYGDPAKGERVIDAQFVSSTKYVSTTMHGDETVFGVNFADGRIKGYPVHDPRGRGDKTFFCLFVRGNPRYGQNDFHDEGDGTVLDRATGLQWMKQDSGSLHAGPSHDGRMSWKEALAWAEGLRYAGHDDWRLPNAKELQSLVDYARSPDTTHSPAIDPIFGTTSIRNEAGRPDFPWFWTSTTHASVRGGSTAVYVAFGRALGWMPDRQGGFALLDVHGAGAQRSDPKSGDAAQYPHGRGPQGDVIRIRNFVRCVRGGVAAPRRKGPEVPAGPAAAGSGPGGGSPPLSRSAWVERLDKDGDGKVSRQEFDGPPDAFRRFDRNGDGFISVEEAPTGPPPGGRPPGGRPGR